MTQERKHRYLAIDLLRGVAALSVLIFHYQALYWIAPVSPVWSSPNEQPWYGVLKTLYQYGGYAVQLFWAISGFVFAASYINERKTARQFAVARFARLYPLHLATLIFVALIQIVSIHAVGTFQVYPHNDAYHFLLNLFFASSWGLQKGFSFNAPIWSVSVEVVIYAFFFITLPIVARSRLVGPAVFMIIAFFVQRHLPQVQFWYCAYYFYIGVLIHTIVDVLDIKAVMLGVALFLLWCFVGVGKIDTFLPWEVPLLFGSVVLIAASLDRMGIGSILLRKLTWIGDSTYGTYLLHMPIIMSVNVFFSYFGIKRVELLDRPWSLVLFICIVFLSAHVCYTKFEKPLQDRLRRYMVKGANPIRCLAK